MKRTPMLHRFPRDKQIALNAAEIMQQVLLALIPGAVLSAFFYGVGVLIQLLLGGITALLCEWSVAQLRGRRLTRLELYAGLLTAALLALSIPATAPWFLVVCGVAFGILLGKHVYGGIGMNIFNPAMVGFCAIYLSFPAAISLYPLDFVGWSETVRLIFSAPIDGITGATALSSLKANGEVAGIISEHWWLNLMWLLGGTYLWLRQVADWRLSLTFLLVFALGTMLLSPFSNIAVSFTQHITLGALIFTACFIITDPTSAATSRIGRIVYATLAALLAVFIRQFSNMPDSMAFAVLLANTCAPLIDHYTRPEYYQGK